MRNVLVVPENIHTPTPPPPTEGCWKFRRGGGSEAKISKGSGGSSLAFFPEGGKEFFMNE